MTIKVKTSGSEILIDKIENSGIFDNTKRIDDSTILIVDKYITDIITDETTITINFGMCYFYCGTKSYIINRALVDKFEIL